VRVIPGLVTMRPGVANEVVEAYRYIMRLPHQPAALALSRQAPPTLDQKIYASASGVARGAYKLAEAPGGKPEIILIASGSELILAVQAHEKLSAEGIRSRVVSMPSWDVFEGAAAKITRDRFTPGRPRPHCAGAGLELWMAEIRRVGWPNYRHGNVRCFGAAQGTPTQVWLRTRQGCAVREGNAGPVVSHGCHYLRT
jgi:transketolase